MAVTEEQRFAEWAAHRMELMVPWVNETGMKAVRLLCWAAWQEATGRAAEAMEQKTLIDFLRAEEMSGIEIINDNPDFGGPNSRIVVWGDWCGHYRKREFVGDSLLAALREAAGAKKGTTR